MSNPLLSKSNQIPIVQLKVLLLGVQVDRIIVPLSHCDSHPSFVSGPPVESKFSVSRLPGGLGDHQDNNIIVNLTCTVQGTFPKPNIRIVRSTTWNTL